LSNLVFIFLRNILRFWIQSGISCLRKEYRSLLTRKPDSRWLISVAVKKQIALKKYFYVFKNTTEVDKQLVC